jgi:hypothetical protein
MRGLFYRCFLVRGSLRAQLIFGTGKRRLEPLRVNTHDLKRSTSMPDDENKLSPEQMAARIAELEQRLTKGGSISFKVSEKGGVSVYGLGRFPVTLYVEQWENLLSHVNELREFIEANRSRLKTKDQPKR